MKKKNACAGFYGQASKLFPTFEIRLVTAVIVVVFEIMTEI